MDQFMYILELIDKYIWGIPLCALIIGCGICWTLRVRFLQIRHLGRALKYMVHNEAHGEGEVTSFGALCTALSATIGTGNIVGVATAIAAGGPGALLWMEIAAFFGMATKYSEGLLAIKYRSIDKDGHVLGRARFITSSAHGQKLEMVGQNFCISGCHGGPFGYRNHYAGQRHYLRRAKLL